MVPSPKAFSASERARFIAAATSSPRRRTRVPLSRPGARGVARRGPAAPPPQDPGAPPSPAGAGLEHHGAGVLQQGSHDSRVDVGGRAAEDGDVAGLGEGPGSNLVAEEVEG